MHALGWWKSGTEQWWCYVTEYIVWVLAGRGSRSVDDRIGHLLVTAATQTHRPTLWAYSHREKERVGESWRQEMVVWLPCQPALLLYFLPQVHRRTSSTLLRSSKSHVTSLQCDMRGQWQFRVFGTLAETWTIVRSSTYRCKPAPQHAGEYGLYEDTRYIT